MKRLWMGVALMALLLAGGIWEFWWLEATYEPAAQTMEQAEDLALQQDLVGASELTQSVRRTWNAQKHITAAFVPHDTIEGVDSLFAQLELYHATQDCAAYATSCTRLSVMLDALGNGHCLTWWNLL